VTAESWHDFRVVVLSDEVVCGAHGGVFFKMRDEKRV
jgi:hypothetical protein